MLSVIIGCADLALGRLTPTDPIHADLTEILDAARRSAQITRQLLAFARKQTIKSQVLDLNVTVESMLMMLRRLIGEDISLVGSPKTERWQVNMDPAQIDQILANLCVNARDAIHGVGGITVATSESTLDETECAEFVDAVPGEYVVLSVSDDGCGMDASILDKLFEPIFTTKELGQGTGLGLATVYGIVKQNGGFITVVSEPDKGSTFKVYVPRYVGDAPKASAYGKSLAPKSRGETVLLVEDEAPVLKMGVRMLKRLGYQVLATSSPAEAAIG